ncbi:MAG: amidohydrolase family protein [Sphingomonas sp.]
MDDTASRRAFLRSGLVAGTGAAAALGFGVSRAFSQSIEENERRALDFRPGTNMPEKYFTGPWRNLRAVKEKKVIDMHCHPYTTCTQAPDYAGTGRLHRERNYCDHSDPMIASFDRHGIAMGALIPAWVSFEQVLATSYAKHKDRYLLTAGFPTKEMLDTGKRAEDYTPKELAALYRKMLVEYKVSHIGESAGGAMKALAAKYGPLALAPVVDVILEFDVPVHFDPGSWSPTGTGLRVGRYETSESIDAVSAPLIATYPDVKFIVAHCGGQFWQEDGWKVARMLFSLENTYTEISKTFNPELIKTVVRGIGPERVMYGSDWNRPEMKTYGPYHLRAAYQHWNSLSTLAEAGLTEEENDWVCYKTARKLLKLDKA